MKVINGIVMLSSAETAILDLTKIVLPPEAGKALKVLDDTLAEWGFGTWVDVVNCRIIEKVRNNLAELLKEPATGGREIPRYVGTTLFS